MTGLVRSLVAWGAVCGGTTLLAAGAGSARPAPVLGVRNAHGLAFDPDRGRVLLFGGADEGRVLGDLWAWDGEIWRLLTAEGPPPRTFPAMSYDRARGRLVLFGGNRVLFGQGGSEETSLRDMWEWDGRSWRRRELQTPPARAEAAMAYDSARRRLVLFGGYRGSGATRERLGDTWEFDGTAWEERQTPQRPSSRNGAAMAYDPGRGRTVLFGGSGGPSAETWEWDGETWTRIDAPTPGRYNSAMAYDEGLTEVVRFGGWDGQARRGDTWCYDGRRWARLPGGGPEPRNHTSMAYDEARGALVLFGGHDGELVFGDTWERRAGAWSRVALTEPRRRIANGH